MNRIINLEKVPEQHNQLFFGENSGLKRIDTIQYPHIKKLYELSESNTWFFKQISYDADITGFPQLPMNVQDMFNKNLGYQTVNL